MSAAIVITPGSLLAGATDVNEREPVMLVVIGQE
jgi:hypothetical protein